MENSLTLKVQKQTSGNKINNKRDFLKHICNERLTIQAFELRMVLIAD
jgi:hypothetical protein